MTKANLRLFLLAGAAASTAIAAAQTSTTHHTSTSTHHRPTHTAPRSSGCVTVPAFSPKIPAAPAGTPCPRALITINEDITFSPLVGADLRAKLPPPQHFSLDYQDIHVGTGELAKPNMFYTVKYSGYLLDGTKFDSSDDHEQFKKGLSFPYGHARVIPAWNMGFEGMHVGGTRRLFVPYQLAYGDRGDPKIPPKSELIFDLDLVSQSATNPNPPPRPPAGANPVPGMPGIHTFPPRGAPEGPAHPGQPLQTPPSAQPQTGPDVKPAPAAPGTPSTPQTQPPTAKQPPPPGF